MLSIAILYSGQPRNFLDCINNHIEFLYYPNRESNIDVFAHFWDIDKENLLHYFKYFTYSRKVIWESPKTFSHDTIQSDSRYYHPLNNIVSQAYSLYQVSEIMNKYVQDQNIQKYDYVVRTRSDNWFVEPINKLSDYTSQGLHITDIKSHTDYALGDTFAFGDYDTMMKYCRLYPDFENICEEGAIVNPECLLGWNIKRNNITVHKHSFYPKLYRNV